ncbi:SRPBCC family protein [Pseudonocardia endophytica]|uniref:SRPBCC family protein n=1 Tax=Pseudonocardia endophytica TaxID=401976 RepID=UPI001A9E1CEE|nr:SRPBCC family protein [Pseudonocardia endophytica]
MTGLPWVWGARPDEVAAPFPCGDHVPSRRSMVRAVDVAADPETVFRRLCQLRVAPYSYDLVDNLGRRSPRTLTPGLDDLSPGQRFLIMFRISGFVPGREITAVGGNRAFGPVACTYRVVPDGPGRSRLVARLDVTVDNRVRRVVAHLIAWGDLVMMRRQLRTLAALAGGRPGQA